jgi:predicted acetyltransferase
MAKDTERLRLRSITAEEFVGWARGVELNFGEETTPARVERWRPVLDVDRCFAVLDGTRMIANAGSLTFDVSLPGGGVAPCAGVTAVGVATDWRRRGLLRRMLRVLLDQAHDRGEPFAALYASESGIYGRFGFGISAPHLDLTIDTVRARIASPVGTDDIELVDAATAIKEFPAVYTAARRDRAGMMSRSEVWWRRWLEHDDADRREGYSPRLHARVPGRGFAAYRWKDVWDHMVPNGTVRLEMLVAADPEAESALWELLFDVDLTVSIEAAMRPPDDAIVALVDNRALVRDTSGEHLYLRLVDLPAALCARRYLADGTLTFTVADEFCPWNAGTWRLDVADGRASCTKVDGHGDLVLDAADLASLLLGGVRPSQLVAARRASARSPSAVTTSTRLFATDRAPWNPFEF